MGKQSVFGDKSFTNDPSYDSNLPNIDTPSSSVTIPSVHSFGGKYFGDDIRSVCDPQNDSINQRVVGEQCLLLCTRLFNSLYGFSTSTLHLFGFRVSFCQTNFTSGNERRRGVKTSTRISTPEPVEKPGVRDVDVSLFSSSGVRYPLVRVIPTSLETTREHTLQRLRVPLVSHCRGGEKVDRGVRVSVR